MKSKWYFNTLDTCKYIFLLPCMKLRTRQRISKVYLRHCVDVATLSDRLSFASTTKIIPWLYLGGKIGVTGGHVSSRNQGLSQRQREAMEREPGNELVQIQIQSCHSSTKLGYTRMKKTEKTLQLLNNVCGYPNMSRQVEERGKTSLPCPSCGQRLEIVVIRYV